MAYWYKFDPSSKKFICPSCNKRNFVKYVYIDTGEYLDSQYGKCDRAFHCAYFNIPEKSSLIKGYTKDHHLISKKEETLPSYIDEEILLKSLHRYHRNGLYQFLITQYDEPKVLEVFLKYRVGTSIKWGGATVFWQTDFENKIRSGKIMKFSEKTGKRVKKPRALINWVHKVLKITNFNLKQVVYGGHLLNHKNKDTPVCIVESEKTAVICALEFPQYLWIATGSQNMFSAKHLELVRGRKVIVFPDTDAHKTWEAKAMEISKKLNTTIFISTLVRNSAIALNYKDGYDLADYIFGIMD